MIESISPEIQSLEVALVEQEGIIRQAMQRFYYEVGTALRKIRNEKLYLARHSSFKEWFMASRDRLGFNSLRNAIYLLEGCETADRMIAEGFDPPPSERHARELNRLPYTDQIAVWSTAIAENKTALSELTQLVEERKKTAFPYQEVDALAKKRVLETMALVLPQATVEEQISALIDVRDRNYKGNALMDAVMAKYAPHQQSQNTMDRIYSSCTAIRRELQATLIKASWWALVGDRRYQVVSVRVDEGCKTFDVDADEVIRFFKQ